MTNNLVKRDWLKTLSLVLFFGFIFLYFFRPLEIEDNWWHLKTAQWILEHKQVPQVDPFSYGQHQAPWIYTQWLGSIIYYLCYLIGSELGLKLIRSLLFVAIFAIFIRTYLRKIPFSILLTVAFLLSFGLGTRAILRPLIFNFLFIQIFLILFFQYQQRKEWKILWPIPLLGVIWFNIHLGSFVFGILIIGIFLLCSIIEYFNAKLKKVSTDDQRKLLTPIKHISTIFVLYFLSFFVNPYGLDGILYPLNLFLKPKHSYFLFQSITGHYEPIFTDEARPPFTIFLNFYPWVHLLFLMAVISLIFNKKQRFPLVLLFIFSFFVFLSATRGSGFYALITSYVIAQSCYLLSLKDKLESWRHGKLFETSVCCIMALIIFINILHEYNQKVYINNKFIKKSQLTFQPQNPITAVEFLNKHNISGTIFNVHRFGGYLIWATYPQIKPLKDGRNIDRQFLRFYASVLSKPAKFWPIIENQLAINCALLYSANRSNYNLIHYLNERKDWKLVFIDDYTMVFIKQGSSPLPKDVWQLEKQLKSVKISNEHINKLKESVLQKTPSAIMTYLNPPTLYIDELEEGVALFDLGFRAAGIKKLVKAVEIENSAMVQEVVRMALDLIKKDME